MSEHSAKAVVVVEFDLSDDQSFTLILDAVRNAMRGGPARASMVYGAIREDAARVLAVFDGLDQP
jgi:hypothetical protein